MAKKARRSYSSRRSYGRRSSRRSSKGGISIPIGGIAVGIATVYQLNGAEAIDNAMSGDFRGAIEAIGKNSVADVIAASIPPLVYGFAKRAMGPVQLFKIGKVRITI